MSHNLRDPSVGLDAVTGGILTGWEHVVQSLRDIFDTRFPVDTRIDILQYGAGQVTVGGAGVTIRSSGGRLKLSGQYAAATLWKKDANEWVLIGDTSL